LTMRAWFWTLLLAALAVALAFVLREHAGNILIVVPPWRIEMSLALAVVLGVALILVVYGLLRMVAWLVRAPARVRGWRSARAQAHDIALLESAWSHGLQGQSGRAEKTLNKLLLSAKSPQRKVLAALELARAHHSDGRYPERDRALATAQLEARSARSAHAAKLQALANIASAALLLEHGSAADALARLQALPDASVREPYAARLLLQAHRQLGHHEQVYDLARLLLRRGVLEKSQALGAIETATAARLAQCDSPGFKALWGSLKSEERSLAAVALQAAAIAEGEGDSTEAARILEAAIQAGLSDTSAAIDARLLAAYAHCPPEYVAQRLSRAEGWLKKQPDHPELLATLGSLCLSAQLWGQGERYLQRSLRLRPDARVTALLGNLYEHIGRAHDAVRQWRLAANAGLPAIDLDENYVLPAADTRGDPSVLDAEIPADPSEESLSPTALKEKHES